MSLHQQILDHMNESAIYNESDLAPFQRRLGELRNIVRHDADSGKHPEAMTKLLERQLGECGGHPFHIVSVTACLPQIMVNRLTNFWRAYQSRCCAPFKNLFLFFPSNSLRFMKSL